MKLIETLNSDQRAGFTEILDHVVNNKGKVFFVDGPGGTGKTYLYRALLAKVRSMDLVAVATATSGIAHQLCLVVVQLTPGSKFQSSLRKILFAISQSKVEQLLYCVRHHLSYGMKLP